MTPIFLLTITKSFKLWDVYNLFKHIEYLEIILNFQNRSILQMLLKLVLDEKLKSGILSNFYLYAIFSAIFNHLIIFNLFYSISSKGYIYIYIYEIFLLTITKSLKLWEVYNSSLSKLNTWKLLKLSVIKIRYKAEM